RFDSRPGHFQLEAQQGVILRLALLLLDIIDGLAECGPSLLFLFQLISIHGDQKPIGGIIFLLFLLYFFERGQAIPPAAIAILNHGEGVPVIADIGLQLGSPASVLDSGFGVTRALIRTMPEKPGKPVETVCQTTSRSVLIFAGTQLFLLFLDAS